MHVHDTYQGKTLVVPPGLLEELELRSDQLLAWGRLSGLETRPYQPVLSDEAAQKILHLSHFEVEFNEENKYVFVTESLESSSALSLARYKDQTFIIPLTLLPDWKGQ
jgi:hypothetical protein